MAFHPLAWLRRLDPLQREILVANVFLLTLFCVGTMGYVLIEGWEWFDGFYMTFITLTTIGFAELENISKAGRAFTIFIGFFGIGSVAFIATRTAQFLLTNNSFKERHRQRMLDKISEHIVICGYGRIGRRVAEDLAEGGLRSIVVDLQDFSDQEEPSTRGPLFVQGDAEDEEVLLRAGADRASALIVTLPEDSANVFITLVAREINPDLVIVARTNDHKNRRKLLNAGASQAVSPDEIGADRMAQVILRPHVDTFMTKVLRTGALDLHMEEVRVQPGALLDGRTLAQANFRQRFDAIVTALVRDEDLRFNPGPHDRIEAGDVLIVLGSSEMIERLRREGCAGA